MSELGQVQGTDDGVTSVQQARGQAREEPPPGQGEVMLRCGSSRRSPEEEPFADPM